jgi:hypothetical protein
MRRLTLGGDEFRVVDLKPNFVVALAAAQPRTHAGRTPTGPL